MAQSIQMKTTDWLAQRLGLSVTTVERLRVQGSPDLPPCLTIGKSKRYDEQVVEQWIRDAERVNLAPAPDSNSTGEPLAFNSMSTQKGAQHGNA